MRKRMRGRLLCILIVSGLAGVLACGGSRSDRESAKTAAAGENESESRGTEEESGGTGALEETQDSLPPELETAPEDIDFQTGIWDGRIFTNSWLGLKVTLPEGSYVYTEEDMHTVVGAGQEILVNGGNYTDMEMKIADAVTVYDFMASLPDGQSNVQLAYENVRLTTRGQGISAEEYLDVVWQQLSSMADMECKMEAKENVELGGQTFAKLSVSLMEGTVYQDYYSMSKGSHMVVFTVSYLPESKSVADELMEGIRAD